MTATATVRRSTSRKSPPPRTRRARKRRSRRRKVLAFIVIIAGAGAPGRQSVEHVLLHSACHEAGERGRHS